MAGQPYYGIEKFIFADTYNLFLKYKDAKNNDYTWESIIYEANMLNLKYSNHPLARSMTSNIVVQLEHIICCKPAKGLSRDEWEKTLENSHKVGF